MESRFGGGAHQFYGMNPVDLRAVGKRSLEWDLNDWKWDGDLFIASRLNSVPTDNLGKQLFPLEVGTTEAGNSSNSSSLCSDEADLGHGKGERESEKKRRVIVVYDDNNNVNEEAGGLSLNLGGHGGERGEVGNWEANSGGKKIKLAGGSSSRAACQVEDCGADLSNAKDYHRRHKVCEMHSKATKARVGNVMQRFCQQCSRFHVLQEFDEGKRSCRRRLAGHNKRRRKTIPEAAGNGKTLNDDQTSGYLLISLLKILSNMNSNGSDQPTDQNLLAHLLRSIANNGGEQLLNNGTSVANSDVFSDLLTNGQVASRSFKQHLAASTSPIPQHDARGVEIQDRNAGQIKVNNFDLNDIYIDSDDGTDDAERSALPVNLGTNSVDCPSWVQQGSHQSSPPQTSGNSDSASGQSPSSSNGDPQSRTDRIVFKLFGKDPNEFPIVLRAQILEWLSHTPTDMESYIRPGCVILTIYLRQSEAAWEELCSDLSSSLSKLLEFSNDTFWTTGWVYVRIQHQIGFMFNGQVVVDTSLPLRSNNYSRILSIRPIAVSASDRAQFSVKGTNLLQPAIRLLCAVEGKYLTQELPKELVDELDGSKEHDELQCVKFSCSIPTVSGRGFIEVEDHGFSGSFFPFIVAEENVCSEIRVLESVLELTGTETYVGETENSEAQNQALDFIHEIGWLLHRSQLKSRLGHSDPNSDPFPLRRFKWVMDFSVDHEWCAVVRKLLNIFLDGSIGTGEYSSWNLALSEMGLLHRAVRKNSRALVEFLLRYASGTEQNAALVGGDNVNYLFKPDAVGPAGLTPLHIAAGKDGSEAVLDALTDDPGMVGIGAWKNARDSTGFTPEDYARLRGHYSYIHMVQKKINKKPAAAGHAVVDIPGVKSDTNVNQKQNNKLTASFEIGRVNNGSCKLCDHKLAYGTANRSLVYRPAMLSMVAIAAVCVCVALLFKSCPEVLYVFRPFRWEMLEYGTS